MLNKGEKFIMVINKIVLNLQDVQQVLNLSAYGVYKLIHEKKLYAYKDDGGRAWKIPEQSIIDYLSSRKSIYS